MDQSRIIPVRACIGAVALLAASMADAQVLDVEFSGDGTGTGDGNIVQFGGTGTLPQTATVSNTIETSNPLAPAAGGYLHSVVPPSPGGPGQGRPYLTLTPTSQATNGFASLVGPPLSIGGRNYVNINGAFDIYFRIDAGDLAQMNYIRPIDYIGTQDVLGAAGLRLAFNSNTGKQLQLLLATFEGSSGVGANAFADDAAFTTGLNTRKVFSAFGLFADLTLGEVQHIGFTISTSPATGQVTARVFHEDGNLAIDTSGPPDATLSFYIDSDVVGATPFSTGAPTYNMTGFPPGDGSDWVQTELSYDAYRLYNTIPTEFPALAIPEPVTGALLLAALGIAATSFLPTRSRR